MNLRPTKVLVFGNPKVGTKLMQDKQGSRWICRYVSPYGRIRSGEFGSVMKTWMT